MLAPQSRRIAGRLSSKLPILRRLEHPLFQRPAKSLEPIFWGNIIIGGTLGSITDFATGAAYQYAPATYQVELRAADQSLEDYQRQLAVRKFSMLYIDEIAADVSQGGGDFLAALVDLVGDHRNDIDADEIAEALEQSDGDPIRFGVYMVGH